MLIDDEPMGVKVVIRGAKDGDMGYLFSSWLKSFGWANNGMNASWETKGIRKRIFMTEHSKVLNQIVLRSSILIACDKEDEDVILGWMVYEPLDNLNQTIIHYVFVRKEVRKQGISKMMIKDAGIVEDESKIIWFTHLTANGQFLVRDNKPNIIFNPYLKHLPLP